MSSTSSPLKTKMRQGCDEGALRASAGSWYFSDIFVPSTRLAALARMPVVSKLGFSLLGGAPPYLVGGCAESSSPRKVTSCEGSGFLDLWCGEGEREREGERVRRRRFGGGEVEREEDWLRCLRER